MSRRPPPGGLLFCRSCGSLSDSTGGENPLRWRRFFRSRISSMRALSFCSIGFLAALLAVSPEVASAQMKLSPKAAAPGGIETRYFTSIDGLMDGNADVILKETRQGKTVTAAVLDVCYPVAKNSDRKDRFVVNLQVAGQNLTGTTQSLGE